jgi:hypothetical protein
VAKGCKITGGVWMANGGTTRITDSRKVALVPMMSFKQAWGLGAYAWTPAQRYAWATNVMAPPRTRAVGVTPLQATNQIVDASELNSTYWLYDSSQGFIGYLSGDGAGPKNFALVLHLMERLGNQLPGGPAEVLQLWARAINQKKACDSAAATAGAILTNTQGWGLGLADYWSRAFKEAIPSCSTEEGSGAWSYLNEAAANNIKSVPRIMVVPDQAESGSSNAGIRIYNDYGTPVTAPVKPSLFGLHAPPDTGSAPTVPYGYLRLWDSAVSWADLNPKKGVYNWTKLQEALASPIAQGREVMYVLGNTPAWAGDGSPSSAPKDMNDVYDFVKALCGQGSGRITTYEAWNEGNLQTFWTGTQEQLAQVTQQVRRALNDCPSGGNVVAASTGTRAEGAFVINYDAYLKELAKLNWPIDGYAVHSYPSASGGPA